MEVQARIAAYIKENFIMQKLIVEKTGYSATKVSQILNLGQKMTADEFVAFCKALGKDPGFFIDDDEE